MKRIGRRGARLRVMKTRFTALISERPHRDARDARKYARKISVGTGNKYALRASAERRAREIQYETNQSRAPRARRAPVTQQASRGSIETAPRASALPPTRPGYGVTTSWFSGSLETLEARLRVSPRRVTSNGGRRGRRRIEQRVSEPGAALNERGRSRSSGVLQLSVEPVRNAQAGA